MGDTKDFVRSPNSGFLFIISLLGRVPVNRGTLGLPRVPSQAGWGGGRGGRVVQGIPSSPLGHRQTQAGPPRRVTGALPVSLQPSPITGFLLGLGDRPEVRPSPDLSLTRLVDRPGQSSEFSRPLLRVSGLARDRPAAHRVSSRASSRPLPSAASPRVTC